MKLEECINTEREICHSCPKINFAFQLLTKNFFTSLHNKNNLRPYTFDNSINS